MLKLRINPIVAKDLKNIRDYIAEDNEEYAAKTIKEIYGKFENLQIFPNESAFGQIINMRYGKIM
jgi:toxin ParE1/3/4